MRFLFKSNHSMFYQSTYNFTVKLYPHSPYTIIISFYDRDTMRVVVETLGPLNLVLSAQICLVLSPPCDP